MRLIDADALRWSIYYDTRYGTYRECMDGSEVTFTSKEVYALIDDAPTIEAEPVVRCKDCNHWKKDVPGCTDFVGRCGLANYMIGATGYCVYAERKAEEK